MSDRHGRFLREVYERYGAELNRYLCVAVRGRQEDVEDISQSTFLKLAAQNDLGKIDNPRAYLYQTARNLVIDLSRKRARDTRLGESFAKENSEAQENVTPEEVTLGREALQVVETVIRDLPPRQRRVFILSRIHHMSYDEIAAETGLSKAGVKQHIVRALAACRRGMTARLPEKTEYINEDCERR